MMKILIIAGLLLLGILLISTQIDKITGGGTTSSLGGIMRLLHAIPDNQDSRMNVVINDYAAASAALQVERPAAGLPSEVVMDYAYLLKTKGLLYKGPFITGFDENVNITLTVLEKNAGYDLRDIDQSAVAGLTPNEFTAINMSDDTHEIAQTISDSKAWPSPVKETYQNTIVLSWGEDQVADPKNKLNPPAYSPTGLGAKLAFPKSQIFYTTWADGIHKMLDANAKRGPSLADADDFQQLAKAAVELKLYSMIFSEHTQSVDSLVQLYTRIHPDPNDIQKYKAELEAEPKLKAYVALATGVGKDANGFYMGLALVHSDQANAQQNADLILKRLSGEGVTSWQKPWNQLFKVSDAVIKVSGSTLKVKLYFANSSRPTNNWYDWFYLPDTLLLHE